MSSQLVPDPVPVTSRRWLVLAVLCLAVFTILVDTSIVNVALPSLVRELDASTRDLLWIVDAYNLMFAALVLAAGSLSDRYGRKGALMTGLIVFGVASVLGSMAANSTQLIAARAVMGIGAAIVFPSTLSIITNVFTDRAERATAIGIWGATTGIAVAFGPITGGWLLEQFWWGSVFVAMAPIALLALLLVALTVPTSRDPSAPRLDKVGLVLSTVGLGVLVFTIIEAPDRGWGSGRTVAGFVIAAVVLVAFVVVERRRPEPMLDVTLFKNLRFSAASGSVAVAFFALFGFIFLITQYFQFAKGYSPLSTGVRTLPVALSVGAASVIGTKLAVRLGNKLIVAVGLGMMSIGFAWISTASTATTYLEISMQMIVTGIGIGLTSAPATEAIMGVVSKDKAGIGSAVNDATREVGGTLGVAVIGSVFASLYAAAFDGSAVSRLLPPEALSTARESIGAAQVVAARANEIAGPRVSNAILDAANRGFFDGLAAGCRVAAGVTLVGSVFAAIFLPARPNRESIDRADEHDDPAVPEEALR
jgi:EmrB/QacA subfamily drug resistance transporter